jgi:hypothetical protein
MALGFSRIFEPLSRQLYMRARFYLVKKLVDSGGAAPIYINIHHRSHRLRYYTGERIKPEKLEQ